MLIHVLRKSVAESTAPWLVLPLFENQGELPEGVRGTPLGGLLDRLIAEKEITGSLGDLVAVHGPAGFAAGSILVVGLGTREKFDAASAFTAGYTLAKRLASKPRSRVSLTLPSGVDPGTGQWVSALVEGVVAGTCAVLACASPRPTAIRSDLWTSLLVGARAMNWFAASSSRFAVGRSWEKR